MLTLLLMMLLVLVAVGFITWLVKSAPFIDESVKPFITWGAMLVAGFCLLYLLLRLFNVDLGRLP